MLLTGALLVVTTNTKILILTFELNRRLKLKVDEVGLLLQFLYGYYSVCFLKTSHSLKVTSTIELRINSCFENTRLLTQTKEKSLD